MMLCPNGRQYTEVSIHNFQTICRFCLFSPAEINLFEVEYKETPLYIICMSQFSVMISLNDGLPQSICNKCENQIRDVSNFKSSVLEAENIFKDVLKNTNCQKYKTKVHDIVLENVLDNTEIIDTDDDSELKDENNHKHEANQAKYTCKYCKETFENPLEYRKHLKNERENQKDLFSSCAICKKMYSRTKLATHMNIHLTIKEPQNFQCDMCGKNYKTKRNLIRHIYTHAGMPHKCDICGKGFREAKLLKDHTNLHSGVSPYLCNLCGKSYATSSALRLHRAYTHNGITRKYYKYPKKTDTQPGKKLKGSFPCEICGKVYSSRTTVNYHVLTHNAVKKFQCNDCGKMFANRSILGDHRRIHRLSYKCTYCDKSFAYAASLETHINSHTGEKPHNCTVCDKRYSNRSHLKEHMRNHTGERPYSCTICGKTFAVKGNLNAHLKTHT